MKLEPTRLRAVLALSFLAGASALLLEPSPSHGWGSATGGGALTAKERSDLEWLLEKYGAPPGITPAELTQRTSAHPIHQFIVYQAWLLLKDDPAMRDGKGDFPALDAINGWDGIDRCDRGMRERGGTGLLPNLPELAPPDTEGPSADAELEVAGPPGAGLRWNPRYNARAHYWNPWLRSGEAPTSAGFNLGLLAFANLKNSVMKAHYASYLAHYIADPLSLKHADMVALTHDDATQLDALASQWRSGLVHNDDIDAWLGSTLLDQAVAIIEARVAALPNGAAWRARVDRHVGQIGGGPLIVRGTAPWWKLDVRPSTFRTAVACYLAALATRPPDKELDPFYTFFDPFYYNGPIYDAIGSYPSFALCTPLSEHLYWETNPAQGELARTTIEATQATPIEARKPWLGASRAAYMPWKARPDIYGPSGKKANAALAAAGADLVDECSRQVHGDLDASGDFDQAFEPALRTAIRCVFTAFRATVTGLRAEAWGRALEDGTVHVQLRVRDLADRPAKLKSVRVTVYDPKSGKPMRSRPDWLVDLGDKAVAADDGDPTDLGLLIKGVPPGTPIPFIELDLHGEIAETPDRGWLHVGIDDADTRIVHAPDASTRLTEAKGPVDVVVVFDTTASMQSSIDSMRANAIASIRKLKAQADDLRLAVVTFRDLSEEADRGAFITRGFTRDLASQFEFLNSLKADGGGDTPEDQLHGVSQAIGLWEREQAAGTDGDRVPAKIIVVVTDAPAKDPDGEGNTADAIAVRAEKVDPAHIYPIVVQNDAAALATAEKLAAKTGGKVMRAASGDEVASILGQAIGTAVAEHPAAAPSGGGLRWALVGLGGALVLIGGVLVALALRAGRRAREAGHA